MYPDHVAIIMDGNGRWGINQVFHRLSGHKAGVERLKDTVEFTIKCSINYLTLYAFSSENWNRPKTEINDLMNKPFQKYWFYSSVPLRKRYKKQIENRLFFL